MSASSKAEKAAARAEAIQSLRNILLPGDTVHAVLRRVSASGMTRHIDFFVIRDGDLRYLTAYMARALDRTHTRDGLRIAGCGMDMAFHAVYSLGRVLFPDGFGVMGSGVHGHCIRPVTRDAATRAAALGVTFRGRNGDASGWDTDGGYALRSAWV